MPSISDVPMIPSGGDRFSLFREASSLSILRVIFTCPSERVSAIEYHWNEERVDTGDFRSDYRSVVRKHNDRSLLPQRGPQIENDADRLSDGRFQSTIAPGLPYQRTGPNTMRLCASAAA